MNTTKEGSILGIFSGECEGDSKDPSVHTPQTIDTGDEESAPAAGEQATTREEAFRALMEGEYKDLFTAYFQETFNRRFKEHKTILSELERSRAVIAAAEQCFGITEREALLAAIRAETEERQAPTERDRAPSPSEPEQTDLKLVRARAKQEVLEQIRARGLRPAESALACTPLLQNGVGKMSRAERAELAMRAARGEQIVL